MKKKHLYVCELVGLSLPGHGIISSSKNGTCETGVVASYPQKVRTSTSAVSEAGGPTHARRHDVSRRDDDDGGCHAAYLSPKKKR